MLTRLKVSGFKNLVDVDVRFGPFTCIAGANGVGKSNLLDAILFLGALAGQPLLEAALTVRDQGARNGDLAGLFLRRGGKTAEVMTFDAEMIVPRHGRDDLGREATASATFVHYGLALGYRPESGAGGLGALEIQREELTHLTATDAPRHLHFPHS